MEGQSSLPATRASLVVFGGYVTLMGLVLMLVPTLILPLFDLPVNGEVWIRLLGFVLLCSSVYYIGAGLLQWLPFARWTVYTRLAAPVIVVAFIVADIAPLQMASFGIVDGLGGLWTWWAIGHDRKQKERR
jgi:hypothetical protein